MVIVKYQKSLLFVQVGKLYKASSLRDTYDGCLVQDLRYCLTKRFELCLLFGLFGCDIH